MKISGSILFRTRNVSDKIFGKNHNTFNSLNDELNPICHSLPLFGAQHILHVSRIRVNGQYLSENSVVYEINNLII
jgi:hypothetical protein